MSRKSLRQLKLLLSPFLDAWSRTVGATWRIKWRRDSRALGLRSEQRSDYMRIHRYAIRHSLRFPALVNPRSLHDFIHVGQLLDDQVIRASLSDKAEAKSYVERVLGSGFTPETYAVLGRLADIVPDSLPSSFVIKTTHDSGSVAIVRDKDRIDWKALLEQFDRAIAAPYGRTTAELHYERIQPRVLVEELLLDNDGRLPVEYKFYCCNGKVLLGCAYHDRHGGTGRLRECCWKESGKHVDFRINASHAACSRRERIAPVAWDDLLNLASSLSRGFRFVRVDMYLLDSRIAIGEITFTPHAGTIRGKANAFIGRQILTQLDASPLASPRPK